MSGSAECNAIRLQWRSDGDKAVCFIPVRYEIPPQSDIDPFTANTTPP